MPTPLRRLPPDALVGGGPRCGAGRLWLLVVGAPIFALAPIAGCAIGGKIRQAALPAAGAAAPAPLAAPEVTLGDVAPPSLSPDRAPPPTR